MSMTDRELLELAAKAAGRDVVWRNKMSGGQMREGLYDASTGIATTWNPLTDDGDALRLAVKLGIYYRLYDDYVSTSFGNGEVFCEEFNDDPYAATRRAIVRAAAEIGRGME